MNPNNAERLVHAREILHDLFPGATVSDRAADADPTRSFAIVPSVHYPRLLVPLAPRSGAAAALRAYGGRLTRRDQLAYGGLAGVLGVVGSRPLRARHVVTGAGDGGIDDHLSEAVGTRVAAAVHLTPARANRKPIVQALSADSRYPLAFAKVAGNPLTAALIEQEAAALRMIAAAAPTSFVAPELLSFGPAVGQQVLVMRPLPTWAGGRTATTAELEAAMAEVVALGDRTTGVLIDSAYWTRLRADIDLIADIAKRDALRSAADAVEQFAGGTEINFGGAHGDWSPWNMWRSDDGLMVWDWERFATDSPVGSDLVHYRLQEFMFVKNLSLLEAAKAAMAAAPDQLTGVLHLLTLAVRYDKDGQKARPTAEWLLPVINDAARSGHEPAGRPT